MSSRNKTGYPSKRQRPARSHFDEAADRPGRDGTDDRPEPYALENLARAVHILVTGVGDARDRVYGAAQFLLLVGPSLKGDLKARFEGIMRDLTKRGPRTYWDRSRKEQRMGDEIGHTVDRMRNKTAGKLADRIFDLYLEVRDRL